MGWFWGIDYFVERKSCVTGFLRGREIKTVDEISGKMGRVITQKERINN